MNCVRPNRFRQKQVKARARIGLIGTRTPDACLAPPLLISAVCPSQTARRAEDMTCTPPAAPLAALLALLTVLSPTSSHPADSPAFPTPAQLVDKVPLIRNPGFWVPQPVRFPARPPRRATLPLTRFRLCRWTSRPTSTRCQTTSTPTCATPVSSADSYTTADSLLVARSSSTRTRSKPTSSRPSPRPSSSSSKRTSSASPSSRATPSPRSARARPSSTASRLGTPRAARRSSLSAREARRSCPPLHRVRGPASC